MILTVQQLLTESLGLINAVAIDETPTTSELNSALISANVMIDSWSAQRLMLRADTALTFSLQSGKATYTVGASGADVTAGKILSIQSAIITDNNVDYVLSVETGQFYDSLQDKDVSTGRPMYVSYDAGATQQAVQKGTISFYYTPDKAYSVTLQTQAYLTEFTNLSDNVTFEPSYYEALIYNLAIRLFRRYHDNKVQIPPDLVAIANEAKTRIMNINSTQVTSVMEFPGSVSKYNIYSDAGG